MTEVTILTILVVTGMILLIVFSMIDNYRKERSYKGKSISDYSLKRMTNKHLQKNDWIEP